VLFIAQRTAEIMALKYPCRNSQKRQNRPRGR